MPTERVAVVGAGISGLGAAWTLRRSHDVTVFERADYAGGHTHTVSIALAERRLPVDTGFIVYNETTYPLLTRLFDRLGLASRPTNMSFSLECDRCTVVYSGLGATGIFADPRNAARPDFLRFLWDVRRFHRLGADPGFTPNGASIGTLADSADFGEDFGAHYLLPLASALWSTGIPAIREFPLSTLLAFFRSHRLLGLTGRLQWRTLQGGSRSYVDALRGELGDRIRTDAPVASIRRETGGVRLAFAAGLTERFDRVIVATHADEALGLLADPTDGERETLGQWRYAESDTWLHSDASFLPDRARARASWNYRLRDCRHPAEGPTMTYNLNRLQSLETGEPVLVTLNPDHPPERTHLRRRYRHPIFTSGSVGTQGAIRRLGEDSRTYFCGAYLGYGFHEDGLRSGVEAGERLGGSFE